MLFIKNLTKLAGSDIRIAMKTGTEITVSLTIAEEAPIILVKSAIEGITSNLKKSFEYIGNAVGVLDKDDTTVSTQLLSNKVTELGFLVKDAKAVFKDTKEFPVTIGIYDEKDQAEDSHYPRDMIVFIVPRVERSETPGTSGVEKDYTLVVDRRNIGCPTIVHDIGDYRIIGMFVKWPIWMRLKFPAYAYIKDEDDNALAGIKLGYKTEKKMTRNQVIDVEVSEAVDYLTESFRILKENREKKGSNNKESNKVKEHRSAVTGNGRIRIPKDVQDKINNKDRVPETKNAGSKVGFPSKFKNGAPSNKKSGKKKKHRR